MIPDIDNLFRKRLEGKNIQDKEIQGKFFNLMYR